MHHNSAQVGTQFGTRLAQSLAQVWRKFETTLPEEVDGKANTSLLEEEVGKTDIAYLGIEDLDPTIVRLVGVRTDH